MKTVLIIVSICFVVVFLLIMLAPAVMLLFGWISETGTLPQNSGEKADEEYSIDQTDENCGRSGHWVQTATPGDIEILGTYVTPSNSVHRCLQMRGPTASIRPSRR